MRLGLIAGVVLCTILTSNSDASSNGGGHGGGGSGASSSGGHSSGGGSHPSGGAPGARGYAAGYRSYPQGGYGSAFRAESGGRSFYSYRPMTVRSGAIHSQISNGQGVHRSQSGIKRTNQAVAGSGVNPTLGKTTGLGRGDLSATGDGSRRNSSRQNPANKNRFDRQTQNSLRAWHGKTPGVAEARHINALRHNNHHSRDWWRRHCPAIILVDLGFWGWDAGWWYPAWGYDPYYSDYDYDGPIYGYDGLPPDEVVANVQSELQRRGYFSYAVDGTLGPLTENALARFQRDHRLPITGAIDPTTTAALGLTE